VWGNYSTGGSRGIRDSHEYVRKGGAAARMMLVQAAADEWKVPGRRMRRGQQRRHARPSGRTRRYGSVAAAARSCGADRRQAQGSQGLEDRGQARRAPRHGRQDHRQRVYGIDVKLPGMLDAAIKDCPVIGGKVRSVDEAVALKRAGVKKVVRVGDSPSRSWPTRGGAPRPRSTRCRSSGTTARTRARRRRSSPRSAAKRSRSRSAGRQSRSATRAPRSPRAAQESRPSTLPAPGHATMEPMNATARYTPQRCEVWTPTQNGEAALAAASEARACRSRKCEVYKTLLGGGFGRRGASQDWVRQAVRSRRSCRARR
jgi:isoquinoline 1-oxidoreductase beta subunit